MTRSILETVMDTGRRTAPVVNLEPGIVWVSGMNQRPWLRARRIADRLQDAGYSVGEVTDDEADVNGGVLIEVDECEPVSDADREEVTAA